MGRRFSQKKLDFTTNFGILWDITRYKLLVEYFHVEEEGDPMNGDDRLLVTDALVDFEK